MAIKTYKDGTPFTGVIGRTTEESSPAWPEPPRLRKAHPTCSSSCWTMWATDSYRAFGGLVETPVLDSLAANGLRYTNMHTTALCSPSRGCILTGRNHHSIGLASITETSTGYPGYNGILPFDKGMLSEMLLQKGYNTFCVGKWHLTPPEHMTPAGPYDRWPLGRGFERYYGFMGGETNQWYPELTYDNHEVEQPKTARGRLSPEHRPGRQSHRVHPGCARQRAGQAFLPVLRHGCRPRAAPCSCGMGGQVQGQVRHGLGRVPQDRPPAPARYGHHPGRHRTLGARSRCARVGYIAGRCQEALYPHDGSLCWVYELHRLSLRAHPRVPERDRRAGQHPDHGHLRQRRQLRGRPGRLTQRDVLLQQCQGNPGR